MNTSLKSVTGKTLPLVRGAFLIAIMIMLSSCCEKNVYTQDGNDAVIYYVCTQCGVPCGTISCEIIETEVSRSADD